MINLNNITLVSVTSVNIEQTVKALKFSSKGVNFKKVILFTNEDIQSDCINVVNIPKINIEEYSRFIVFDLHKYIDTEFALIIQHDGFVINPESWREEFLNYDYIGAPWPLPGDNFSYRDSMGNLIRVGNGGFSLRSKKLLSLATALELPWRSYYGFYNEDGFFTCHNRHIYEENGCAFAPLNVAKYFSHETPLPELVGITPFGFHGKYSSYMSLLNTV